MTWELAASNLRRWHEAGDRDAARVALAFVESELRLLVPPLVRRTWPAALIEDALQEFLEKLLRKPLPQVDDLRSYLSRAFRNHCIDLHEARQRREKRESGEPLRGWEAVSEADSPAVAADRSERAAELHRALGRLEIADRIVLKLEHGPEWLDGTEVAWLGERLGMDPASVRKLVASADDTHALTQVFDPVEDDPRDPESRRRRMERFRRRRARARDRLRALLEEGS